MLGSRKIILQFSVNWLVAIWVVGAGVVVAYAFLPTDRRPLLVFGAAVAGACAALMSAGNAIGTRATALEQEKLKLEAQERAGQREKEMIALSLGREWNNPQFFHAKVNGRLIMLYFKAHHGLADQKQFLAEDPARLGNLHDILNFFECLSIAIQVGLADEGVARRFFRSLVQLYWRTSETFIKARRAERDNTRLYQEVEWLSNRWKD